MHDQDLTRHARALAVPTLRTLLRQRRNAVRHSKVNLLHLTTARIRTALRCCAALDIPAGELAAKIGRDWPIIATSYDVELEARKLRTKALNGGK